MRASRLLSILMILQARGRATGESLAAEFEVSVRTIYRDVDELSAAGVPVEAERGPGGGFRLRAGYRTHLTGLTPDEAATLLLAGLPGAAADLGLGAAMASAERKMLAALPTGQAEHAHRTRQRVLLDPLDWYRRVERPRFLPDVAAALWNQARIAIHYESWKGLAARTLEPFGLVMKAGVWYLVARRNQTLRTYRVAQIVALRVLQERFDVPTTFELGTHWALELKRFESELRRGHATVRVSSAALSRIERLGADAADAVRAGAPDATGWRTVDVPIESVDHAALELLGFGPHVQVLAPQDLVLRLRGLARAVHDLYKRQRARAGQSRRGATAQGVRRARRR